MAAQVEAHLSHVVSEASQFPHKSPTFWEKHIHAHLQKRLFSNCKDDPMCAKYAERIAKKIKESPKDILWLLQQKEFKALGIKIGHRAKFKQMMHSILHPAPTPLICILKKALCENESQRYMAMSFIVRDLNAEVPRIHRLSMANAGRWEVQYVHSSRRSTLYRFLSSGLLNKG